MKFKIPKYPLIIHINISKTTYPRAKVFTFLEFMSKITYNSHFSAYSVIKHYILIDNLLQYPFYDQALYTYFSMYVTIYINCICICNIVCICDIYMYTTGTTKGCLSNRSEVFSLVVVAWCKILYEIGGSSKSTERMRQFPQIYIGKSLQGY